MKYEKSCGAIIYQVMDQEYYILVIKQKKGHWSFPKGHVKKGETEIETALREIKEETNLDVKIDSDFKVIETYKVDEDTIKNVIYFLAQPITKNIKVQEEEVTAAKWVKIDQVQEILTYFETKDAFQKAKEYLKKNHN